jgi:hypothetical protein
MAGFFACANCASSSPLRTAVIKMSMTKGILSNGDSVLAFLKLNRFPSPSNKKDIGSISVYPPPRQDALLPVERHEVAILPHPSSHGPNVFGIVQQKLLLLQARNDVRTTIQRRVRNNVRDCCECQRSKSAHLFPSVLIKGELNSNPLTEQRCAYRIQR